MIHENTFGKFLEKNRNDKNVSITKLCRGLCSVPALTRYERDARTPEKVMADALLERLGIKPFEFEFILSDDEFHQVMLRKKIQDSILNDDLIRVKSDIAAYRDSIKNCPNLHMQYILLWEGEIAQKEKNNELAAEKFREALECTEVWKDFEDKKYDILFSETEMELIFQYAECLYHIGEWEQSGVLFDVLQKYMKEIYWDSEKRVTYYPHILYRMAEFACEKSDFDMAEQMLTEAKAELTKEYQLRDFYEVLVLLEKVRGKMGKEFSPEEQEFLTALKIINLGSDGEVGEEGIKIWRSTVNRQF